jgi:beta-glucanase (GH16 family)
MLRKSLGATMILTSSLVLACGSGEPERAASGGSGAREPVGGAGVGTGTGGAPAASGGGGAEPSGGKAGAAAAGSSSSAGSAGSPSGGAASGGSHSGGTSASGGTPSGGAGSSGAGGTAVTSECPSATWKLAWSDEFDGASGSAVDASKWTYDTGPNWYNGELQDYTSGATNASLDGNGNLVIEARKEAREGRDYTSARLKTEGKKTFTYGRFEGRMKLPYGQGMWPAFWMLGGNNWPNTGEVDIMENLGREPSIVHGTMHGPGYSGSAGPTAMYTLPGGAKVADDYHVFAVEWEANAIRWYVDGTLYSTKTPADVSGKTWVFDHGFFIILNLAVGGDWPGDPDDTTVFPQKMVIDYVRVCQK